MGIVILALLAFSVAGAAIIDIIHLEETVVNNDLCQFLTLSWATKDV